MSTGPRIAPCGDRTLIVYLGDEIDPAVNARVHATAAAIRATAHPAIIDVSPAYASLLVEYDPVRIPWAPLTQLVEEAVAAAAQEGPQPGRLVELPVRYGGEMGPDLGNVAAHTDLSEQEVIDRHAGQAYRVYCLGFSPGFCYLGGLDPQLHIPRMSTPRTRVPIGSVAIGGSQTGIYPTESPGGWHIIGRTPLVLFDPNREPPAIAQPGDRIRFVPVSAEQHRQLHAEQQPPQRQATAEPRGQTGLRVLRPGMATTVQDHGRRGYQAYGVPVAGAVDHWAIMVGNWILANQARAAALEITLIGPEVEFTGPVAFCLTGAPVPAELLPAGGGSPRPIPGWRATLASPGDQLRIGAASAGCRSYLCVAGGIDLPPVLGSLSEDLLGGLGPFGRPLQTGDWLPVGLPLMPPADLAGRSLPADLIPAYEHSLTVRVTLGPQEHAFTPEGVTTFLGSEYTVSAQADRQGIRMTGPQIQHATRADIISEGVPVGGIQVPASGQPIMMLHNRGSTGGYTKIAVAIYPDVARAAQLRPGDRVRFQAIDLAEAHAIAWSERRRLAQIRRLLRPQERGTEARLVRATLPTPVPAAPPPTAPEPPLPAPDAGPGARRYRIRIGAAEFAAEVEEFR